MLNPFLRAKHHWYRDEHAETIACLEEILGERALYVSDDALAARAGLPFESFVTMLLASDRHLMVPFAPAVARAWQVFPGYYAIASLEVRGEQDADWLHAAAADGVLSTDPADHDRIAKVVLAPVPDAIDRARLDSEITAARAGGAWLRYIRSHPHVTTSLFLDAVYYPARVIDSAMVIGRLEVIAAGQPEVIDVVADTLPEWDPEEVARVGMRVASGSPSCTTGLVDALRRRDFEALPASCLPARW